MKFKGLLYLLIIVLVMAACTMPSKNSTELESPTNLPEESRTTQIPETATATIEIQTEEAIVLDSPGYPVYIQYVTDCRTGPLTPSTELIQPGGGCDSWQIQRYERPFNAIDQNVFFPDLDVWFGNLGRSGDWFYLNIEVAGLMTGSSFPNGSYGIEIDLDQDRRGDILILATGPGKSFSSEWSTEGVQVWLDTDNDVGFRFPDQPDNPATGNGYDLLAFDQGQGDSAYTAWSRVITEKQPNIEIAFKSTVIGESSAFRWWVWSDAGVQNPGLFDYQDAFSNEMAGDVYQNAPFFPANQLFALDNTCAAVWGMVSIEDAGTCTPIVEVPYQPSLPSGDDPNLDCTPMDFESFKAYWYQLFPDSYPAPYSLLLMYYDKYLAALSLLCGEPPDIPPTEICPVITLEEYIDWWYDTYPETYPQPYSLLMSYYSAYVEESNCAEDDPEEPDCIFTYDEFVYWLINTYPDVIQAHSYLIMAYEDYLNNPFCEELPQPTPTPTTPPPPPQNTTPTCNANLNQNKCTASGGKWVIPVTGGPGSCKCP